MTQKARQLCTFYNWASSTECLASCTACHSFLQFASSGLSKKYISKGESEIDVMILLTWAEVVSFHRSLIRNLLLPDLRVK